MFSFNRFALLLIVFMSQHAWSQTSDSIFIKNLADEILLHSRAYEQLAYLTKKIGPRLAGSSGMVKAEQWGLKEMQKGGADKVWGQECMVPHWVRGGVDKATAFFVSNDKKGIPLDVVALGNSIGTGSTPIRASVVEVKSFEDLELKREVVKGKIVFYNYQNDL